ncbi:hypothetical protein ACJJTC_014551 [Scirpophaga incertulas]
MFDAARARHHRGSHRRGRGGGGGGGAGAGQGGAQQEQRDVALRSCQWLREDIRQLSDAYEKRREHGRGCTRRWRRRPAAWMPPRRPPPRPGQLARPPWRATVPSSCVRVCGPQLSALQQAVSTAREVGRVVTSACAPPLQDELLEQLALLARRWLAAQLALRCRSPCALLCMWRGGPRGDVGVRAAAAGRAAGAAGAAGAPLAGRAARAQVPLPLCSALYVASSRSGAAPLVLCSVCGEVGRVVTSACAPPLQDELLEQLALLARRWLAAQLALRCRSPCALLCMWRGGPRGDVGVRAAAAGRAAGAAGAAGAPLAGRAARAQVPLPLCSALYVASSRSGAAPLVLCSVCGEVGRVVTSACAPPLQDELLEQLALLARRWLAAQLALRCRSPCALLCMWRGGPRGDVGVRAAAAGRAAGAAGAAGAPLAGRAARAQDELLEQLALLARRWLAAQLALRCRSPCALLCMWRGGPRGDVGVRAAAAGRAAGAAGAAGAPLAGRAARAQVPLPLCSALWRCWRAAGWPRSSRSGAAPLVLCSVCGEVGRVVTSACAPPLQDELLEQLALLARRWLAAQLALRCRSPCALLCSVCGEVGRVVTSACAPPLQDELLEQLALLARRWLAAQLALRCRSPCALLCMWRGGPRGDVGVRAAAAGRAAGAAGAAGAPLAGRAARAQVPLPLCSALYVASSRSGAAPLVLCSVCGEVGRVVTSACAPPLQDELLEQLALLARRWLAAQLALRCRSPCALLCMWRGGPRGDVGVRAAAAGRAAGAAGAAGAPLAGRAARAQDELLEQLALLARRWLAAQLALRCRSPCALLCMWRGGPRGDVGVRAAAAGRAAGAAGAAGAPLAGRAARAQDELLEQLALLARRWLAAQLALRCRSPCALLCSVCGEVGRVVTSACAPPLQDELLEQLALLARRWLAAQLALRSLEAAVVQKTQQPSQAQNMHSQPQAQHVHAQPQSQQAQRWAAAASSALQHARALLASSPNPSERTSLCVRLTLLTGRYSDVAVPIGSVSHRARCEVAGLEARA